jgi:nitrite reductase/ring-hydroxylating ferredoxin subunit
MEGGDGIRFTIRWYGQELPAFAIRYRNRVYAYLNRCAHQPVQLDWVPGKFFDMDGGHLICATHGARYYPDSGACAGGRCDGRGLTPLPVAEHNREIVLVPGEQDMELVETEPYEKEEQ